MARVLDSVTMPIKKNGTTTPQEYVNNPKSTAPQFSASTAYTVGQYVFYEKKLYRFKAAHAAGAWNAAHVDEVTVASELTSHGADITELKADFIELDETAARIDGSYDTMTVGNAKQLTSNVGINDKAPYLFRTAGGANDIGDREEDTIVGGSVVWNQLASLDAAKWGGSRLSLTSDGTAITLTPTSGTSIKFVSCAVTANHKYLATGALVCSLSNYSFNYGIWKSSGANEYVVRDFVSYVEAAEDVKFCSIFDSGDAGARFRFQMAASATTEDHVVIDKPQLIDLTAMFGATIADYIYGLETATEGAGVAWLKKYLPLDSYIPYCEPTIKSVSGLVSHNMTGFNAYDNTTGKAKVVGGNVYQITGTYTALTLNGETITPDTDGYFTPDVSGELMVTGGNSTDTCVHLVWDGERDGEYEAYNVNSYTLDDSLTLCGIPKLDAGNNLYYDGDKYLPDGTVERRYYAADLGEVTWTTAYTGDVNKTMRTTVLGKGYNRTKTIRGICDSYNIVGYVSAASYVDNPDEKSIGIYSYRQPSGTSQALYLVIPKDSTPSGHLVYEVATTTTETADPYQTPQVVDDWGTEEYVCTPDSDGAIIPVGHDTFYSANLKAKLEMSPDSPGDGDGDYIVRQTNGLNEYAKLVIPAELPTSPSEDGTYTLKATVADGTVTLAWVADT